MWKELVSSVLLRGETCSERGPTMILCDNELYPNVLHEEFCDVRFGKDFGAA